MVSVNTTQSNTIGYIGDTLNFNITKANSNYKTILKWTFRGYVGYIPSSNPLQASSATTLSLELGDIFYFYLNNAMTDKMTVEIYTYNLLGQQIGEPQSFKQIIAIKKERCIPTITANIIDINSYITNITKDNTKIVRGQSKAKITPVVTTKGDIKLKSYKITCGSAVAQSLTPCTVNQMQSLTVPNIATNKVTITVTDERGISNTVNLGVATANWFNYTVPTISDFQFTEMDINSTKFTITGSFYNSNIGQATQNLTLDVKLKSRDGAHQVQVSNFTISKSGTTWTATKTINFSTLQLNGIDITQNIVVQARVNDMFGSETVERPYQKKPLFHWDDEYFQFNIPIDIAEGIRGIGKIWYQNPSTQDVCLSFGNVKVMFGDSKISRTSYAPDTNQTMRFMQITFPKQFANRPRVFVTPTATNLQNGFNGMSVDDVNNTSFKAYVHRTDNYDTYFNWFAIGT